jgi:nicotinate phosphoribosyltransferase
MGVSKDAPSLDLAYKLAGYAGRGRLKTSPGKPILPGRKQIFRVEEDGRAVRDVIARWGEEQPGRPLLRQMMRDGSRLPESEESLEAARDRARREVQRLPDEIRSIDRARYPVEVSRALQTYQQEVMAEVST